MPGLALKSLRYRAGLSLVCALAVALGVASLGASLGVGDALTLELERLARARRGEATDVLIWPRPLSPESTANVAGLGGRGAVVYDERARARVPEGPHIESTVLGIDDGFTELHGLPFKAPKGREAWVSRALASALGVAAGKTILVDLPKARVLSASLLFGDRSGAQATLRLRVARVLGPAEGGEFTLRPSPDLPRTVFTSLEVLKDLAPEARPDSPRPGVANRILLRASEEGAKTAALGSVTGHLSLEDFGVRVEASSLGAVIHTSEAAISPELEASIRGSLPTPAEETLVYLATGIDLEKRSVPYSVVMGLSPAELAARSAGDAVAPASDASRIWLSEWTARDLGARVGSSLTLHFDIWRQAGRLEPLSAELVVAGIVPDAKAALDRDLVPRYPGISDAPSLGEWDPPFPIQLAKIRPADELFWKRYGPSPKAYLEIETARRLFGDSGSRLTTLFVKSGEAADVSRAVLQGLRAGAPPFMLQDLAASSGASSALDFGAYFAGFSALLILSALLVAAAFVRFLFETRSRELGVLRLCGWTAGEVRRLCLTEASLLAALGALLGLFLTPLVSMGLQRVLRPVWARGISEAPALVTMDALLISTVLGFVMSMAALALALRVTLKREPLDLLLSREGETRTRGVSRRRLPVPAGAVLVFALTALLIRAGRIPEGPGFFLLGASALTLGLGLMRAWTQARSLRAPSHPMVLGFRGLRFRPARVLFVAALLSSATFVVFAVSSFAKKDTSDRTIRGPRGGYDLFVETSGPVFDDLVSPEGRARAGLGDESGPLAGALISRFRLREGEDTSCLNLHAPRSPRILGVEEAFRKLGRFAFAASLGRTEEEKANPWTLLRPGGGEVAAIVDANSLQYVLHKKLGDTMEILDGHGRPLRLRFVASLGESALRSEILISEEDFQKSFPAAEGYRVFLAEAPPGMALEDAAQALRDAWRDRGALVSSLADRLARYYEVENTYLASFQWLGALAAALSTLTLAAVAARSVFERRAEWFVLRTTGFSPRDLRLIVASEITALALFAVGLGGLAAALALFPLPRASQPAATLTLLFPVLCLLSTAAATFGAFRMLEDPRASRPAIG